MALLEIGQVHPDLGDAERSDSRGEHLLDRVGSEQV
jgi:hypothetical protein